MNIHIAAIAAICHEANRAYCLTLGDTSVPSWLVAPDRQRQSVIHSVQAIIDNPDMTPEQSHKSWLAEKDADGWNYGSVKDVENKKHPCFLPYEDLPDDQKVKYALLQAVARALLR